MDAERFDRLTRTLTQTGSRRRALATALAGSLGLLGLSTVPDAQAKNCKKIKHKQKRKKCLAQAKSDIGTPCIPSCERKICGDDGCAGSCGTCGAGTHCLTGSCVPFCQGQTDGTACGGGQQCSGGVCATPPTEATCQHTQPNELIGGWYCAFDNSVCCSGVCTANTNCAKGGASKPCRDGSDCISNQCVGFSCQ